MHLSSESTDEEIVLKIQETRDTSLFEILYERHVYKVFNKCIGFTNETQSAEDLTHDIFLKAFINLKSYQGKSKFYTWLYSLTYNYCVDFYNSKKKDRERLSEFLETVSSEPIHDDEPSDAQLFEIRFEQLKVVLEEIPTSDKIILLMKYQDDFSIQDISESLELGISAVKMRIKRAKLNALDTYDKMYRNRNTQNR